MLVLVIFAACLLVVQIGVGFFQYKLHGFFKFCIALVVTVVIWQGMHAAIVWHANRTITHEYVLTELAKQGFFFNPDAEELLAPRSFFLYDPNDGKSALISCGEYCIENYCSKGINQKIIYENWTGKGIWEENYTGICSSFKGPEIAVKFNKVVNFPYIPIIGFYQRGKKSIYIGNMIGFDKFKIRAHVMMHEKNLIAYFIFLDYWDVSWLHFFRITRGFSEVPIRKSSWPEFINVGNTNEL